MYSLLFISLYFEVFLLVSFLDRRRAHRAGPLPDAAAQLPRVAVAVPCFNEEKTVALTLRSLLTLEYPKDRLDIIVVDDGSTDGTLFAARAFADEPNVRIYHKENGGKHTAMNYALDRTDAELIACLDADSTVAPGTLRHIAQVFVDENVAAVTPGIHVREPKTLLQHMQHVEYRLAIFNRFIFAALGSAFITPGPFSIFRTSIVRDIGGWQFGHSTEDMELALRMQSKGYQIANAPGAAVYTATPLTIPRLFHQRVRWTYGFLRNAADYRYMLGNRAYGNLGVIVLPAALISIGTGIYFFLRAIIELLFSLYGSLVHFQFAGSLPQPELSLFYVNTSSIWFLIYAAVALIIALISIGSFIGTGRRLPPAATPLFLLLYGFLVPVWLGTALVRAVCNTGVRWR
jgi:cellulose synthase/poly-beta-1,6-N-acetylglucosamine synthase-like glycosyltransferase